MDLSPRWSSRSMIYCIYLLNWHIFVDFFLLLFHWYAYFCRIKTPFITMSQLIDFGSRWAERCARLLPAKSNALQQEWNLAEFGRWRRLYIHGHVGKLLFHSRRFSLIISFPSPCKFPFVILCLPHCKYSVRAGHPCPTLVSIRHTNISYFSQTEIIITFNHYRSVSIDRKVVFLLKKCFISLEHGWNHVCFRFPLISC